MANKTDWSNIPTYNGKKPFVFISYAHKDFDAVAPTIEALQGRGYRVWLDLGIEAGTEWANNIAAHLKDCAAFVVFISKNSMASEHCLDEIAYAKSHQKPSLMVFLEDDVEIPEGIEMQTARFQRMYKTRHSNHDIFVEKICEASFLDACKDDAVAKEDEKKNDNKNHWALPVAMSIVAALSVIAMAVFMFLNSGDGEGAETTISVQTAVQTTVEQTEALTLSDNLLDFNIKIGDTVYKFPCDYETVTESGWTISTNGYSPTRKIAGRTTDYFYMANQGNRFSAIAYNASGNAEEIQNCVISGVEFYFDEVDFELPNGITADSSAEDIINAYGAPHEITEKEEYNTLIYRVGSSHDNYIKFTVYRGENHYDYSSLKIVNIDNREVATETKAERPSYLDSYVTPTALGDDVTAGIIRISGDLYRVPTTVSAFLDNGWKITSKPGYVVSGGSDSISLERDGKTMNLTACNYEEYQTIAENCIIASISMFASDGVDFELPGGITFDSTREDVAKAYPDFKYYDGTADNYSYTDYGDREFYISINVGKDTGKVATLAMYENLWIYE